MKNKNATDAMLFLQIGKGLCSRPTSTGISDDLQMSLTVNVSRFIIYIAHRSNRKAP